jgi:DNA mismatch repair protein MutS
MAGMPPIVVKRAKEILKQLEQSHSQAKVQIENKNNKTKENYNYQLSFFQLDDPVLTQIKEQILSTDIDNLTPVEALLKLHEIKKLLGK